MRKHGWELPYHPLQVVAVAVFLALGFAFYVFFAPFVGNEKFQYIVMGIYTPLANRDVTRVEIFMSLVRLLEQTAKGSSPSSANAFDGNNKVVQHSFPEAASIPATDRATSLQ